MIVYDYIKVVYVYILHLWAIILLVVVLVPGLQYEELEKIGEGSFGVVHKCRKSNTDEIVAIKTIFFHEFKGVPPSVIREITLLKKMDHPNIVK